MSEPEDRDRLGDAVRLRRERQERWRRQGERSIGQNFGLIGALGASVVVPTLLGVFTGRWIDHRFHCGVFWTAALLVAGLAIGCILAWQQVRGQ